MGEGSLGFNERKFLELYRRFYKEPYPAKEDNNQNTHVQGQKAVYLLMLKQVNVGDYGFTWQQHGPCSDALQEMMRELDKVPDSVEEFYQNFPGNDASDKMLYSDSPNTQRLFCTEDASKIDSVRKALALPKEYSGQRDDGDTPMRRWMELLGSLTYISTTRLPGASEERVWEELQKAKSKAKYLKAQEKDTAFQALRSAKLLSCIGK